MPGSHAPFEASSGGVLRYRLGAGRPRGRATRVPTLTPQVMETGQGGGGIDGLRVHDLRHTAATHGLAASLTVHAVADLLGHTDARLVLRLYGHALRAEKASAAERLEEWRLAQRG